MARVMDRVPPTTRAGWADWARFGQIRPDSAKEPEEKCRHLRAGKDLRFEWMLILMRHEDGPSDPVEEGLRVDADHLHAGSAER